MPPFFRWHRTCAMARRALCACWPDVARAWRRQGRKPKSMKYDADRTHSASSVIGDIYPPPLRRCFFLKNPVDRRLIPPIIAVAALVFLMFAEAPVWVGAAFLAKGHMRSGHFAMELVVWALAPGNPLTVAVLGMRGRTLFSKPVSRLFPITPRLGQLTKET